MEKTTADVLLLPGLLTFLGALVYAVALATGLRQYNLPQYRWAGLALLVVATLVGAKTTWALYDSLSAFYRLTLPDRKVLFAHYLAPLLPLAAIGLLFGAEAWFKRYRRSML